MKLRWLVILVILGILTEVLFSVRSRPPDSPNMFCKVDIRAIETAIQVYRAEFASYPIGTNTQVLHRLYGGNPRRLVFLQGPANNGTNHFFDPWGTDIKIEVSEERIRIQSAGKNKKWDDSDDVVFEQKIK